MHGDFSRMSFDSHNRFSAVVALQGRVSVEADHNEHTAILLHHLRMLAVDVLGRHAWPSANPGFEVGLVLANGRVSDLSIGAGRCYVDGILVENPPSVGAPTTFHDQPDAYFERVELPGGGAYFVYLEVWERLVTAVEDPTIGDVALGGPDTSARTKVVWQARFEALRGADDPALGTVEQALEYWRTQIEPRLIGVDPGAMAAGVERREDDDGNGVRSPGGYRGLENRLYRVEIHSGGVIGDADGPPPTFKWSRDNGSVVYPMRRRGQVVTLTGAGADDGRVPQAGDWVELVDDASVLDNEPVALRRVEDVDAGKRRLELDAASEGATGADPNRHPLLRRWDQQPAAAQRGADNAIEMTRAPLTLEDGIDVSFTAGSYRAGDFWVFPARVATRDIEWPRRGAVPVPRAPDGVRRSYAPLALVKDPKAAEVMDLRLIVAPR